MSFARRFLGPRSYDEVSVVYRLLRSGGGCMVDVGAHVGHAHASFADDGWTVIALEPDPHNRAQLESRLKSGVTVDSRAVSDTDGEIVSLFTSPTSTGISSLAAFHPTHKPTATVKTVRLDTLLAEHGSPRVRFLKVDTEGFDLPVLGSFPWSEQKPESVVCEFEDAKTVPLGYTYRDIAEFLTKQGYAILMSEWFPIVEYGQSHKWRRIVRWPAELIDSDGWGNFIAVSPDSADRALRIAKLASHRLKLRRAAMKIFRRSPGTKN